MSVQRDVLIAYLKMKVDQADWHGVSDAANDLRVLEAEENAEQKRTTESTDGGNSPRMAPHGHETCSQQSGG